MQISTYPLFEESMNPTGRGVKDLKAIAARVAATGCEATGALITVTTGVFVVDWEHWARRDRAHVDAML